MPPHNSVVALHRPRTLANVLLDLREARSDWEQATSNAQHAISIGDDNAADEFGDRASEADKRIDALRDEFDRKLRICTGLSWKEIERAQEECLI